MKKFLLISFAAISFISAQAQLNLTVASQYIFGNNQSCSNIWGYVDGQGNEYALVGAEDGMAIVNVTVPTNPVLVTQIPGPSCSWREIKTIGNYAYITSECGSIGLQIVNLTNLPSTNLAVATWTPNITQLGGTLSTIHELHATGNKLYLYGHNLGNKGIIIADVTNNPMAPTYVGNYNGDYVHDGEVRGNTCYGAHVYGGYFSVMDVTNPAAPVINQTQNTPNNFTHNTWTSTDGTKLYTTDEVSNSYLASYDISNINNIQLLDRVQVTPGSGSIVHNTYTINVGGNDYEVASWYKDGVVIVDVGRPSNMVVVGYNDIYPSGSGGGFNGTWGVYPYLPSGNIITSNIEDGLRVLAPTYVRACYLEGVVTDFVTTLPINAATITITSLNITDNSISNGNYGVGTATAGTYSVTYSKAGYISQTFNETLTNGNVTLRNVALVPLAQIAISGQVINSWNSQPVPNANIRLQNNQFTFDTICDANGNYTFPAGYPGNYTVTAGKWMYQNKCTTNVTVTQNNMPPVMVLDSGIFDEFTWDYGWVRTGNAATGLWQRGEPLGTTNTNPGDANPEFDVNYDCTDECYVTGNTGTSSSDDDVDAGYTTISSPVFSLVGYTNPKLEYARWFFNAGGNGSPNDSLRIYITNGTTTVLLDNVNANNTTQSTWLNRSYYLSQYLTLTNNMRIRVRCVDTPQGNLVEGGFDRMRIVDSIFTVGVNNQVKDYKLAAYPNPFENTTNIEYHLANELNTNATLMVFDMTGRVVKQISITGKDGVVEIKADVNAGVYFVKIVNGSEITKTIKIVKTK